MRMKILVDMCCSQTNTSEIRGEVEQTRWQLLQESGVQKTELLRARQDMVNRIIQMGEKVHCFIHSSAFSMCKRNWWKECFLLRILSGN
jgi:hypothetical protein